jgi:hypothetical protein
MFLPKNNVLNPSEKKKIKKIIKEQNVNDIFFLFFLFLVKRNADNKKVQVP